MKERCIIGASPGPRGTTIVRVKVTSLDGESWFFEEYLLSDAGGWSVYDGVGKRRLTKDRMELHEAMRFVLEQEG